MPHTKFLLSASMATLAFVMAPTATAKESDDVARLQAEIAELRRETDMKIATIVQESNDRIAALARAVQDMETEHESTPDVVRMAATADASAQAPASGPEQGDKEISPASLNISGDARFRFEQNFEETRSDRSRGVVRARMRVTKEIDPNFTLGARLVTGNPDDPNTADVTLSNFDDDVLVDLDQLYLKTSFGPSDIFVGKFDNPFIRTDMVWDGDVNPQGIAAVIDQPLGENLSVRARAIHFLIDEASGGLDSSMTGGQIDIAGSLASGWSATAAAAYYDYTLNSLTGADAGDFRSNLTNGGAYVSDYNLVDLYGSVAYKGLSERLPVKLVANYVKNQGAEVSADEGFGADLFVGRLTEQNDWRVQYGYASVGVDAVFAAFSHDNTDLPTNYMQHTLGFDYALQENLTFNATYYRYRVKDSQYASAIDPDAWSNRIRLNFMYNF